MQLGGRILGGVILSIVVCVAIGLWIQRSVIRTQGVQLTRENMRTVILEAENARQAMSRLNDNEVFDQNTLRQQIASAKDIRQTPFYGTIPVVAAWSAIQEAAKQEGYGFRVVKRQARNPANEPNPAEAQILESFAKGQEEYFAIDHAARQIVYARPIRLTSDCLKCHGDPATSPTHDGRDIVGFPMENWKAGEIHGAFLLRADLNRIDQTVRAGFMRTAGWTLPAVVLVGVVAWLLTRRLIIHPLHQVMRLLQVASGQTLNASSQIASASQTLAQGASEQAASLEETSSAMHEISAVAKRAAEATQQAAHDADAARTTTERGQEAMEKVAGAMEDVQNAVTATGEILKSINSIAFQTNLLALNAAVEAARAGEAGRGFAIVAHEVRELAGRSREAAVKTADLLERSLRSTQVGATLAKQTKGLFQEAAVGSQKISAATGEIASASADQARTVDEITRALQQVDQVTQGNAASAEQSAAASQELASQIVHLNSAVEQLGKLVGHGTAP